MQPVLKVEGLGVSLGSRGREIAVLQDIAFDVRRGEVLGIVGESGSGKSLTASAIMALLDRPARIVSGRIVFGGNDLVGASEDTMRSIRGRQIAMVFQDPSMSLNPLLRIETQMVEAVTAHEPRARRRDAIERARLALDMVGVSAPAERLRAYPHQLSGGMRQRVAIAIAMLHRPPLIIADEPTTALDVTIQGQILKEMGTLCREIGTALIWISHDLSLLSGFADRLCVMYAGRVVETGPTAEIIQRPRHPYSRGLIMSLPALAAVGADIEPIPGTPPSVGRIPQGCAFRTRCARTTPGCTQHPQLREVSAGHTVACFHPSDEPLQVFA